MKVFFGFKTLISIHFREITLNLQEWEKNFYKSSRQVLLESQNSNNFIRMNAITNICMNS